MTRACKVCGQTKPLDRYHFQAQMKGAKRYYVHECLDCSNARRRARYQVDSVYRHKSAMQVARWIAAHPDYMPEYQRNYKRKAK